MVEGRHQSAATSHTRTVSRCRARSSPLGGRSQTSSLRRPRPHPSVPASASTAAQPREEAHGWPCSSPLSLQLRWATQYVECCGHSVLGLAEWLPVRAVTVPLPPRCMSLGVRAGALEATAACRRRGDGRLQTHVRPGPARVRHTWRAESATGRGQSRCERATRHQPQTADH